MAHTEKHVGTLDWVTMTNPLEVLPVNDIRTHMTGRGCWCRPVYDHEFDLISHNSADGRERYAEGRRKLN